jgi:hypothetical protein
VEKLFLQNRAESNYYTQITGALQLTHEAGILGSVDSYLVIFLSSLQQQQHSKQLLPQGPGTAKPALTVKILVS